MIHIDRLHRAICRLTGSPFCFVVIRHTMAGTAARRLRPVLQISVRDSDYDQPLHIAISHIKRDHGWDSRSQSSSRRSSQAASTCGSNCTPADREGRRQREVRAREPVSPEQGGMDAMNGTIA